MQNRPNQIKDYVIDYNQIVNEGQEIETFKCQNIVTNEQLFVKIFSKQQKQINWEQEKENFEKLKLQEHSNVLQLYDLVEENDNIYIFLETYEGDLSCFFKNQIQYIYSTFKDLAPQIIAGYLYLRKQQIVVRDMTTEAILYKRINGIVIIKISSFALVKNETTDLANTTDKIPLYKAPETQKINAKLTDTCDIYSLGIIFYRLYFQGDFPEQIQDQKQQKEFYKKLKNKQWKCPTNAYTTNEFIKLIENMIVYDPKRRCTWEQLDSSPELQQKFIIWKDKYLIKLTVEFGKGAYGQVLVTSDLQNNQTVLAKKVSIKNQPGEREKENQSGQREKQIYESLIDHNNQNIKNKTLTKKKSQILLNRLQMDIVFQKNKNIIHRDLKPDNIVIVFDTNEKPIYKLIDFGAGKILTQSNMPRTFVGTLLFQAPEVLRSEQAYDYTCDIFSLGIILFYMVFKQYPCNASNEQELRKWHEQIKQYPFRCPINQEPEVRELIEIMLLYDRTKRITWEQLQIHPLIDNKRQKQREVVTENNQQIQQQQQIIVFPEKQELHQQQEYIQQQSQNIQSQQSQNYNQNQFVKVQNSLNICIENYEHTNEMYDNQQFALNSSEFTMSKNEFENQNSYNQRSIQQIQEAPLNNQNIITQENEISSEYIYKIMLLTRRFVIEADEFLEKHEHFQYKFQLIFQIQFALRFLTSCIQTIDQIFQNKTIKIKRVSFKNDSTEKLKQQINQYKFEAEIQKKDQKYSSKIDQISSDLKVKMKYITLKNEIDEIIKVTHLDIDVAHHYFCDFYQTFRKGIFGEGILGEGINQNDEAKILLLLRYLLEKMNNIFNDYPVDKPQQYQLKDIYYQCIKVTVQEEYLKRQQF